MKPSTAVAIVSRVLSLPGMVALSAIIGAVFGATPAAAQALDKIAIPVDAVPVWLAPFMPVIIAALVGASTTMLAWMLKTFFGTTLAAFAAFLDGSANVIEARAKRSKDPNDDAPASALAAGLRAAAARLRAAEGDMPTLGKGGK